MKKLLLLPLILLLIAPTALMAQKGLTKAVDFTTVLTIVTNRYDNGKKSTEYSENAKGKKEGKETVWYQNGQVQMERNWKNGQLHGTGTHYHRNGKLHYKEHYVDGVKTGKWTYYSEDGTTIQEIEYTGNSNDGTYTYYHSGVAFFQQEITDGNVTNETVLNQEIYDQAQSEAEAAKKAGK